MSEKHVVIIIPGLGDDARKISWATQSWNRYGFTPIVHPFGWYEKQSDFHSKLDKVLAVIDSYHDVGSRVSLVGCSAGGSAVLNAFFERKGYIHRVITVCGRLRTGSQKGFRSFTERSKSSPAFAESVRLCEKNETLFSDEDRKKIMTVRSMFGDELVPSDTSIVRGAYNITVPTPEHMLSIGASLTVFSRRLLAFINQS